MSKKIWPLIIFLFAGVGWVAVLHENKGVGGIS